MTTDPDWRPQLRADIVWTMVEDEAVVVLPDEAKAEVLNATGARVLALADGTRTVADIAAAIADEFDVEVEAAGEDVRAFLADLDRLGLLRRSG